MISDSLVHHVRIMFDPEDPKPRWFGGPTAVSSVEDVDANCAAWKPAPDRHSIWELVLHIAYWKYEVRKTIDQKTSDPFPRMPDNRPEISSRPNKK